MSKSRKAASLATGRLEPKAGRPIMPANYGLGKARKGTMKWPAVTRQLEGARNYWIATTRSDGRPHAMPVWGFWLDGALFFGTGRDTLKARNLQRRPAAIIHLESGDDVVILECLVSELDLSGDMRKKLDKASQKKYKMPMVVAPDSMVFRAQPKVALAWREKDFPKSATRWTFDNSPARGR